MPHPLSPAHRLGRLAVSAGLLWLVWVAWRPAAPLVSADIAQVRSRAEAARLAPGREFVAEGAVHPARPGVPEAWRGRFVFQEAARVKDDLGASFLRVARDARPAVRLRTPADEWLVPAASYSLRYAPEIPPRHWHAWNQENRGFRVGDAAVARGVVRAAWSARAAPPRSASWPWHPWTRTGAAWWRRTGGAACCTAAPASS